MQCDQSAIVPLRRVMLAGVSMATLLVVAHAQAAEPPVSLPEISVTGETLNAETEGTGSYTSPAATLFGKLPAAVKEIPGSVSVITRQVMDDWNMITLQDALSQATGVTAIPNDGTQAQYNSRSYGMNVMFNGIPSYNALSGSQQFDLSVYDRIEILRGTAGMLTGTDPNPGGTVNLVAKRARKAFGASATASYGSWANTRGVADVTGPLNADGSLRGRAVISSQHNNYFYDHASGDRKLAYGTLEYDVTPDTTLSVTAIVQQDRASPFYGIPVYSNLVIPNTPRSFNPVAPWAKNHTDSYEQDIGLEHRFDNGWVAKAQARWWERKFRFNDGYASSSINPATDTISYSKRDSTYNYVRQNLDMYVGGPFTLFGLTHNAVVGYNRERYLSNNAGGTAPVLTSIPLFGIESSRAWEEPAIAATSGGKSETFQEGGYGQLRLKIAEPLTLVGGGRLAYFTTKSRSIPPSRPTGWVQGARRDGEFVPYGGVIVDATKEVALYASVAQIFIPQTTTDHTGRTLDPRYGTQYETGVKGAFLDGRLNASLAVFQIEDTNRAFADAAHPGYYLQMGEVRSRGVDAEVTGSPLPGVELTAGYSYLFNTYVKDATSQGMNFSNWFPKHSVKLLAMHRIQDGPLEGFNYGAGVTAVTRTGGNGSNAALVQDAYALVNAQIGYAFSKTLSVSLTGNNLFDEKYFAALGRSTNTYNTYGTPRNVMLALTARM
ncbi:TonB-dependent siderophore receptor [Azospirillum palustre]|uniref:TonB-dependent siderophore receptor n=2 Tax=Azospirillum palustre TaxID=2044885 RepID=A0A2B8BEN1_9PROT|nr:TonB-dependent siderophore receptor [Azospirillum palustre]